MAETTGNQEEVLWSWLHVSDVHLGHGDASWRRDQELVLGALREDVPRLIDCLDAPKPMDIICTGDIAATGGVRDENEYVPTAASLFADLQALCDQPKTFAVPGNHDVRRTSNDKERAASRLLRCLRNGSEPLDASYEDSEETATLAGRFATYSEFARGLEAPVGRDRVGAWTEVVERGGLRIRLVGLNTSVLCNDDHDERQLRIGKQQLVDAFAARFDADLTIVLGHHPPSWLESKEQALLEAHLFKGANLYLHGHLHDPKSTGSTAGSGGQLVTISAGALHQEESEPHEHAYSISAIVRLANGTLGVRVWPRRWRESQRSFLTDTENVPDGERSAFHPLEAASPPALSMPDAAPIEQLSAELVARIGRRRTAYPTDLSIRELYDQGFVVPAKLSASDGSERDATGVAEALAGGDLILALGAAGAGKTMFAYEVAQVLTAKGVLGIAVDLNQVGNGATASPDALLSHLTDDEITAADREVVWLVDGVDELLADRMDPAEVAERLEGIAKFGRMMVTCRELEFKQRLARSVPDDLFDSILELREWRADHEFREFVERLHNAGRLDDGGLAEVVCGDPELSKLVRRPLLARMLTSVAEDGVPTVSSPGDLYANYLGKLSQSASTGLRRIDCTDIDPSAVWRELAWVVFHKRLKADAVPVELLLADLGGDEAQRECVYRALSSILDIGVDPTSTNAGFSHYSFYEFLLAQEVARRLVAANAQADVDAGVAAADDTLAQDLTQEVRRHLVSILRSSVVDPYAWPRWLAKVYRGAGEPAGRRQTVCNLVAYIACRGEGPAVDVLRELAAEEVDPFLRNSLMWALTREGDHDALGSYLADLDTDQELADLNRGYLLYYFGDINRAEPPFPDDGTAEWSRTRSRLSARFAGAEEYTETEPTRQAVDLYTFCDFAAKRGETLTSTEDSLTASLLADIEARLPSRAIEALRAVRDKVRPQ